LGGVFVPGAEEPVTSPVGVPLPSVLPAPPACDWPPVSTVLLAWMIACRNGCTPSETLAMIAIPASTATGRSQLMASRWTKREGGAGAGSSAESGRSAPGCGSRRSRGQGTAEGAGIVAGQAQDSCQAQCPRQVQCLARPRTSAAALISHGRGGR
jgi:hypothetical protein